MSLRYLRPQVGSYPLRSPLAGYSCAGGYAAFRKLLLQVVTLGQGVAQVAHYVARPSPMLASVPEIAGCGPVRTVRLWQ